MERNTGISLRVFDVYLDDLQTLPLSVEVLEGIDPKVRSLAIRRILSLETSGVGNKSLKNIFVVEAITPDQESIKLKLTHRALTQNNQTLNSWSGIIV